MSGAPARGLKRVSGVRCPVRARGGEGMKPGPSSSLALAQPVLVATAAALDESRRGLIDLARQIEALRSFRERERAQERGEYYRPRDTSWTLDAIVIDSIPQLHDLASRLRIAAALTPQANRIGAAAVLGTARNDGNGSREGA